jgi:hypothetical protein
MALPWQRSDLNPYFLQSVMAQKRLATGITVVTIALQGQRAKIYSGFHRNRWRGILLPIRSRTVAMTRRNLLIALAGATGAVVANAVAQKSPTSAPQDKFAIVNNDVKELLLLMDSDRNGKISKQEWMHFMEAEFNRLDREGKGELDVRQLSQSRLVKPNNP